MSLEVADPTSLPAAITKLLRVVATLPRLERFVGDVCQVTPPLPALLYFRGKRVSASAGSLHSKRCCPHTSLAIA